MLGTRKSTTQSRSGKLTFVLEEKRLFDSLGRALQIEDVVWQYWIIDGAKLAIRAKINKFYHICNCLLLNYVLIKKSVKYAGIAYL